MEIKVKGHSGCSVNINREDKKLLIIKGTNNPKYVSRLEKQALKQKQASELEYQFVRIPRIYDIKKSASTLSVKMEYIYSKNYIEHFETAGFEQIKYFINAIKLFIDKEISLSPIQLVSKKIYMDKFADVKQKLSESSYIKNDLIVKDIIIKSEKEFNSLPKYFEIPVGICHGDLTYSNILFNGNNYYLIDFLDSFIETPLMDMVKIKQDSAYHWSNLMYTGPYDELRLKIISDKIDKDLTRHFNQYVWFRSYYKPFQIMNFLRILQYAKEEKVISYLKDILNGLIN